MLPVTHLLRTMHKLTCSAAAYSRTGMGVCIRHTYEYIKDVLNMRTITYVYDCQMSTFTRVQIVRNLHIL